MGWSVAVEPVVLHQARCRECRWSDAEPRWSQEDAEAAAEAHRQEHIAAYRIDQELMSQNPQADDEDATWTAEVRSSTCPFCLGPRPDWGTSSGHQCPR